VPLLDLHEALPDLVEQEVLRRLGPTDRTMQSMLAHVGRPWLAAVLASGLRPAVAQWSEGTAPAQEVLHVRRAAGLAEGERVPVGPAGQLV